jgi:hypothetical protein
MTKRFTLLLLFLITSCANREKKKELILESWIGRPVEKLKSHPYFKNLPMKKIQHEGGIETWMYRDQTRFQTDAYCQSLGGCIGLPTYNCDHAFSVKDGKILGYDQNGNCPGASTVKL